jgi:hypothetical protein
MEKRIVKFVANEPPGKAIARCQFHGGRAPEHATARGEIIGACSDLKLYWSAEICAQVTAQAEKIFGQFKFSE